MRLLLHSCCAPCLSSPYERVSKEYDTDIFYFNPNVSPLEEYELRLEELSRYSEIKRFRIIEGERTFPEWERSVAEFKDAGERSHRCYICYKFRMEEAFRYAKNNGYDFAGTVLSVSPHKNVNWIHQIGDELESLYGVKYLKADFKKEEGFKRSVELSKEHGFYRQDYCGCSYSKAEREARLIQRAE